MTESKQPNNSEDFFCSCHCHCNRPKLRCGSPNHKLKCGHCVSVSEELRKAYETLKSQQEFFDLLIAYEALKVEIDGQIPKVNLVKTVKALIAAARLVEREELKSQRWTFPTSGKTANTSDQSRRELEEWETKFSKYYGAMFECGDFEELMKHVKALLAAQDLISRAAQKEADAGIAEKAHENCQSSYLNLYCETCYGAYLAQQKILKQGNNP